MTEVENDNAQIEGRTSSVFGERLDYEKTQYRDVWAMVLFYGQVLVVALVGIYFWMDSDGFSDNTQYTFAMNTLTSILVTMISCLIIGLLFGFLWLQILKKFASIIIKAMLFFNLAMWAVVIVVGFATEFYMAIIGIIAFLFTGLYTYCVWSRIPFSSVLLSISSKIITRYNGTVCISICMVLITMTWIVIWSVSIAAYYFYENSNPEGFILFLFFVSLFWGCETWRNSTHTTTCGVAATWYFNDPRQIGSPTYPAFKRTMTTSFGSVAFGSLIVAILEALRAIISNMQTRNSGEACLQCILLCVVGCIENLIRYFNQYAYAQCAIYGTGFIESSKNTWSLFEKSGVKAIINDDLTGMALFCGAIVGFIVSGLGGYLICWAIYDNGNDDDTCTALGWIGAFLGLFLCFQVIYVCRSAIICLFVCWSEDPAVLKVTHPNEFNELTGVRPDLGETRPLVDSLDPNV